MGLSIIIPIYDESKKIEKFFNRLSKQTQNNYEIIFLIDTNKKKCLQLIDKFNSLIKGNIKILYNSKRQGRYNSFKKIIELISKDYFIILSISDFFNDDLVETVNKITNSNNVDIIEFSARSHKPIWFNGYIRKKMHFKKEMNNEQKADIFAYTYPFEFNKIIKTQILKQAFLLPKINSININWRFTIEIIFKCILIANSYFTLDKKIVRFKKMNKKNYNPFSIVKEWDRIIENELFIKYYSALEYNKYFSMKVLYQAYIKILNNNDIQNKFNSLLKKFNEKDFYDSNIYILKNIKEANILKKYKNINNYKMYKEL